MLPTALNIILHYNKHHIMAESANPNLEKSTRTLFLAGGWGWERPRRLEGVHVAGRTVGPEDETR